jgi:hypothetical protein
LESWSLIRPCASMSRSTSLESAPAPEDCFSSETDCFFKQFQYKSFVAARQRPRLWDGVAVGTAVELSVGQFVDKSG